MVVILPVWCSHIICCVALRCCICESLDRSIDSVIGKFQFRIYSAPPPGPIDWSSHLKTTSRIHHPLSSEQGRGEWEEPKVLSWKGLCINNMALREERRDGKECCCCLLTPTYKHWASLILPIWVISRAHLPILAGDVVEVLVHYPCDACVIWIYSPLWCGLLSVPEKREEKWEME